VPGLLSGQSNRWQANRSPSYFCECRYDSHTRCESSGVILRSVRLVRRTGTLILG
jgi:hypothetical protein